MNNKEVIKRFEERFGEVLDEIYFVYGKGRKPTIKEMFINFLLQELQTERERIKGIVEGRKEICEECENREIHETPRNNLLSDLLSAIDKEDGI